MATPQAASKPTDFISTQAKEAVKFYAVYDGTGRMTETYTAAVNASDGDPCLKTSYVYDGSSNRVTKSKEEVSTWSSSYDI